MINKQQEVTTTRPTTLQAVQQSGLQKSFAFMLGVQQDKCNSADNEIVLMINSGASDHMVNQMKVFTSVEDLKNPINITVAKKWTTVMATKIGTINVVTNKEVNEQLLNILYSPDIPCNLMSALRRMQ